MYESIKIIVFFFHQYLRAVCRLKESKSQSSYICFKKSKGSELSLNIRAIFAFCNTICVQYPTTSY